MPLTNSKIKNAKAIDKDLWMTDQKGLRLLVKTNGAKYWRFKYRFNGKQKTLAFGVYPEVSLKEARERQQKARKLIRDGVDPSEKRKEANLRRRLDFENSMSLLAKKWWESEKVLWKESHAKRVWRNIESNLLSTLGNVPVSDINTQQIIRVVKKVEEGGAPNPAKKLLQYINRIFKYGVQMGFLEFNPATELPGIVKLKPVTHRDSLPKEHLSQFLKDLDLYDSIGNKLTTLAIKLVVYTFQRPGNIRLAEWHEFDLEERMWRIAGNKMKMGTDHIVPLSKQVVSILEDIKKISGGKGFLFPSIKSIKKPMSENTMRRAIFKLGYDGEDHKKQRVTPSGFRATASSILNEKNFNPDAIERQLAHMERNKVRAAYTHHAQYLDERKEIMQFWADYLDQQRIS